MPSQLVEEEPKGSRKPILIGVLLVACVGLGALAVLNGDEVKYQLETANNIVRSWRCPPGGFPAGAGQGGNCLCEICPRGHKCAGGNQGKRPCGLGTYQDLKGQNACKPARPGTYVPGTGYVKPRPCELGHWTNKQGQRQCSPASPGHHVPGRGATSQTQCPVGRYQNQRGQKACKPARKGHYVNKKGQPRDSPCNYGSYQDRVGQTSCKPSPPGNYVPSRGASKPTPCGRNTFQHCNGQTRCIPCEAGLSAGQGATKCTKSGGVKPNSCTKPSRCVFPFKYQGLTYRHCATRDNGGSNDGFWCSYDPTFRGRWTPCGSCKVSITSSCKKCSRGRGGFTNIVVKYSFPRKNAGVQIGSAWIGLVPRGVASRKESVNDARDVKWFRVTGYTGSGVLKYNQKGLYDIKAFTSDNAHVGLQIGHNIPIQIV